MTYGAFLVEVMFFNEDTSPTSTEPSVVLGIEAGQFLGQINPSLRLVATRAMSSEDHHSTHVCPEKLAGDTSAMRDTMSRY
jgi:hypothetical protein